MYSPVIGWITIVSMSISAICLIIYIILYFIFSSSPNRLMFLFSCCLLLSHVLVGPQLSFSYPACYEAWPSTLGISVKFLMGGCSSN